MWWALATHGLSGVDGLAYAFRLIDGRIVIAAPQGRVENYHRLSQRHRGNGIVRWDFQLEAEDLYRMSILQISGHEIEWSRLTALYYLL
jgi:hypothetical protein